MEKLLPKGWVKTEFGAVNQRSVTKNIEPSNFTEERFELYSVPIFETGQPEIQLGEDIKSSKQLVESGDVLVCKINPRINRVWVVGDYSKFRKIASSEWIVFGNELINSLFLKYQFQSKQFRTLLQSEVSGVGGSLTRARPKLVNAYPLFLPPLPEQERIVAKLDKLFAQHEKIKKALGRIPQLLKVFRQQVLTQAVTGKLTEQWREGKGLEEWREDLVGKICDSIVPGRDKPKSFTGNIPWITTPDFTSSYIYKENAKLFLSESEIKEVRAKKIPVNSVVISIVGRFGVGAIIKEECVINQQLHAYLPSSELLPEFLLYQMLLKEDYLKSISSSTTIAYINKTKANNIPINIAPYQEQEEIVRRVENLFAKADAIEACHQTLKTKIASLPQAILHKAFKGELVPQLPTDGDAKDLLNEIIALRKETKRKKKM